MFISFNATNIKGLLRELSIQTVAMQVALSSLEEMQDNKLQISYK